MVKTLALAALLATTSIARAQPSADTAEQPSPSVDPEAALRLSTIGSAVPAAMIGLGALVAAEGSNNAIRDIGMATAVTGALVGIVTPALGELYSRDWLDGPILLRASGVVVEFVGLIHASSGDLGDCEDAGPSCHLHASTIGMLVGGAALYFGGMALDVVHAPRAAREWNRRHEVIVVPTALQTPASTATGLALALKF